MVHFGDLEARFVTGSQHLYGPDVLKTVQQHADTIAKALTDSPEIPVKILPKPVMTGSDSIYQRDFEEVTRPTPSNYKIEQLQFSRSQRSPA